MPHLLVHIHSGPDLPAKATLGCLVALSAAREGHQVTLFLAGDGISLLDPAHAGLSAPGTGRLGDHLAGLRAAGVSLRVSRLSAAARGHDDRLLAPHGATFALPEDLVTLTFAADRTLTY